ncbi:hypothetical protein EJ08DRAFT_669146 [Tothia fuscella]|uniref:Asp/Glu/hydantoin racemase n=1 Tax=Tothia fuscella TaxID=1048955 RepID=A0A9P4U0M5_9PEZI|nr:hypothetical protein EJ08DRAFT_669146 [Tothia fuscella]
MIAPTPLKVLVINPNTSTAITDTFKPILSSLHLLNTTISYWTCPTGPAIIKSQADMYESTRYCIPPLLRLVDEFDGFLTACYAAHPLPRILQSYVGNKPVVGIFIASIAAALTVVAPHSKFGILTTGEPFEPLLADGVRNLQRSQDYKEAEKLRVHFGMVAASGTDVLCMGGVILLGMENWVHEACEAELGIEKARQVKVIDQLVAGMWALHSQLRHRNTIQYDIALT